MGETSVRALKYFFFRDSAHPLVVEFSPYIIFMVFDEVEIVTAVCITFMNTNGMNVVGLIIFLDFFKNTLDFLFYLPEDLIFLKILMLKKNF